MRFVAVFDTSTVYSGTTALIAGLVSSVHCVAMCGPLSCAFLRTRSESASPHAVLSAYHLCKLCAYLLIGALAGAFGGVVLSYLQASWLNYLPWILVFFFVAIALRLNRFFPKPIWLGRIYKAIAARYTGFNPVVGAGILGAASPLLPCGPLYLIFGLSMFSGSAAKGAEFAAGFGIGTIPLLWLAQSQYARLNGYVSMRVFSQVQRWVAMCAALVVLWRLRATLGIETAIDWICR
jgi:sulfite exporter TauE/SafE